MCMTGDWWFSTSQCGGFGPEVQIANFGNFGDFGNLSISVIRVDQWCSFSLFFSDPRLSAVIRGKVLFFRISVICVSQWYDSFGLRRSRPPQAPQHQYRRADNCEPDAHKENCHESLLPGQRVMTGTGNG
jgi:hypothetical protein